MKVITEVQTKRIFIILLLFAACWFFNYLYQIISYVHVNKKNRYYLKSDVLKTKNPMKNGLIIKMDNDIITISETIKPTEISDILKVMLGLKNNKLIITVNDKDTSEYDIDNHVGFSLKRLFNTNLCKAYNGAEDFRIIQGINKFFIFYSGLDVTGTKARQCLLVLEKLTLKVVSHFILKFNDRDLHNCEKNWTPWVYHDDIHISYWLNPHIVYKVDITTGVCHFVSQSIFKNTFPKIKGGSKAVLTKYGYLGIAHTNTMKFLTDKLNMTRVYSHYFYLFSQDYPFEMKSVSRPFTLSNKNYEFVNDLYITDDHLYINIGVEDIYTQLRKIHLDHVIEFINNS